MKILYKFVSKRFTTLDELFFLLTVVLLSTPFYFVKCELGFIFSPLLAFDHQYTVAEFGIPVALAGLFLSGLMACVRALQGRVSLIRPEIVLSLGLIAWMTLVMVIGLEGRPSLNIAIYLQTVLPWIVLVIFLSLPLKSRALQSALYVIPVVGSLSILLLAVALAFFLTKPYPVNVAYAYLAEAFYPAKNIQPIVVLAGMSILLWEFSRKERFFSPGVRWLLFIVHAAYVTISWSRTGVLMILVMVSAWMVLSFFQSRWSKEILVERLVIGGLILLMTTLSVTVGGLSVRVVGTAQTLTMSDTLERKSVDGNSAEIVDLRADETLPGVSKFLEKSSPEGAGFSVPSVDPDASTAVDFKEMRDRAQVFGDNRRKRLFFSGLDRVFASPIFGDSFNAVPAGEQIFGREEKSHKIYPSHNQYLDLAIRAGLPTLLLVCAIFIKIGFRFRRFSKEGSELSMVALAFLLAVSVGCFFQNYLVVTQAAAVIHVVLATSLRIVEQDT